MKKVKISFDAHIWNIQVIKKPSELLKAVFRYIHPAELKTELNEMMKYSFNGKIRKNESSSTSLLTFNILRSIIRVSYSLYANPKKKLRKKTTCASDSNEYHLFIGNLTSAEYADPFITFRNVFKKEYFEQIEFDLFDIVEHALSKSVDNPSDDISISFINIHRLLDACWLIYKRENDYEDA